MKPSNIGQDSNKTSATRLHSILKKRKIGVEEFANKAGLTVSQASKIVNGKQTDMLLSTAVRICKSLRVGLTYIFKIDEFEEEGE